MEHYKDNNQNDVIPAKAGIQFFFIFIFYIRRYRPPLARG